MKRVLVVAADGLTKSGVPNVFMNIIRNLSEHDFVFDVLYFDENDAFYKDEIEKYGGNAIYSPIDTFKTSKFKKLLVKLRYKKEFKKVLKQYGPYYCVHSFKGFESGYFLKAAKRMGINHRISHMTFYYKKSSNPFINLIEAREKWLVERYSSYVVSDSERTANNNVPMSQKSIVIRNSVDDEKILFSSLSNESRPISFIQIGSYCTNKNQMFSIELFKRIVSKYPDSKFHFIGFRNPDDIDYLDKVKLAVQESNLSDNIYFHKEDADSNELFKKCHYLLFPSHIESFGIVVVEAQMAGLSCFCSNSISEEGNCGGCTYLPLEDVDLWEDTIINSFNKNGGEHKEYDCSRFKKGNIVKQYLMIYEKTLSKGAFKSKLQKIFAKIKSFLADFENLKKAIISLSFIFVGAISLLAYGATNIDTKVFKSAVYASELIEQNDSANYISVIVEQKKDGIVPDTATELRSLYGAFGNRESNYAGTINAQKDRDITFVDFDVDKRLSFVYVQTGVQVSDIEDDKGVTHHRMEFYPLELMFGLYPNNPTAFYSFMYLSTSQARKVINNRYPGMFDESIPLDELLKNDEFVVKCFEIIGTGVNLNFNGEIKNYQVTNIFYEKDYFYNTVTETIGEFLVGYNKYPTGFQKQATYFLNKYDYQNKFYLNYINGRYNSDDCDFDVASIGLNSLIEKDKILDCFTHSSDFASTFVLGLSIILIFVAHYIMFRYKLFNLTFCFYSLLSIFVPYGFGYLLWKITSNASFFSPKFTISILICLIAVSITYICCFLIKKVERN